MNKVIPVQKSLLLLAAFLFVGHSLSAKLTFGSENPKSQNIVCHAASEKMDSSGCIEGERSGKKCVGTSENPKLGIVNRSAVIPGAVHRFGVKKKGGKPGTLTPEELDQLCEEGFGLVIAANQNKEQPAKASGRCQIQYIGKTCTQDHYENVVRELIVKQLRAGKKVAVHCDHGMHRAGCYSGKILRDFCDGFDSNRSLEAYWDAHADECADCMSPRKAMVTGQKAENGLDIMGLRNQIRSSGLCPTPAAGYAGRGTYEFQTRRAKTSCQSSAPSMMGALSWGNGTN